MRTVRGSSRATDSEVSSWTSERCRRRVPDDHPGQGAGGVLPHLARGAHQPVEAEGIDPERRQLVLMVHEPVRTFEEQLSKRRVELDRTKVKVVREIGTSSGSSIGRTPGSATSCAAGTSGSCSSASCRVRSRRSGTPTRCPGAGGDAVEGQGRSPGECSSSSRRRRRSTPWRRHARTSHHRSAQLASPVGGNQHVAVSASWFRRRSSEEAGLASRVRACVCRHGRP